MNSDSNASSDIFEHDPTSNTSYTTLEWTTHDPSVAVVELLARLLDVDPIDLEPLASSIDPAALDALLQGQRTRSQAGRCTVVFTYLDHRVTVSSDGRVEFEPLDDCDSEDRFAVADDGDCEERDGSGDAALEENQTTDENGDGDLPRAD